MITCPHCGTQNPDHYTQCPNCGSPLVQPTPQPQPQPQPTNAYIPPAMQEAPVTSVGGWFGWYMLLSFLPIIGSIIMVCTVKDPSAKNYAKLVLICQIIVIVCYVLFFAVFGASMMSTYR